MSSADNAHIGYDPVPDKRAQSSTPVPVADHDGETEAPAKWGIDWRCPTLMIGLLISGAIFAVGHHFYYRSFAGARVASREEQVWAIRIGTGFAFLIKSCLVSSVGLAAVQETWSTVRRKSVRLSGIDSMFAVRGSPLAFLTPDLWLYAKTLTALAIVCWLIPLTAIVTPATLSVISYPAWDKMDRLVPNVNFDLEYWRNQVTYTSTAISSPSADMARLFTATASSAQVLPVPAPFSNSSYQLSFWGPSYKCHRLSEALAETDGVTQDLWDEEMPEVTFQSSRIYMGTQPTALNNTLFIQALGANPLWNANTTQPAQLVCQLWNTSYVVDMRFVNDIQTLTPISVDPIAYANWNGTEAARTVQPSYTPSSPSVNAGFHVIHLMFSGLLQGELVVGKRGGLLITDTDTDTTSNIAPFTDISLAHTALFTCPDISNTSSYNNQFGTSFPNLCRNGTLAHAIEDLSHNFTYSLLSLNGGNTTVPVTDRTLRNYYFYGATTLLLAYMSAVAVSIICVVIGFVALRRNGVAQGTSFSSVLLTTRNPELDRLAVGHCLGVEPLRKEMGEVTLRFGEVEVQSEGAAGDQSLRRRHAAFGTKDAVAGLDKGVNYY
ncbi:hypothetical protein BDW74DRAFT_164112 [Aspergillus multicolor]|uniref:uncharacterized protein n=1 Tax=Aspergillus multicolor TaxID=41759 RepID=UPI003CCE0B9D